MLSFGETNVDEIVAQLDVYGYSIVKDFLPSSIAEAKRAELTAILDHLPEGRNDFEGFSTRRIYALFAKTRCFDEPATHPLVLGVVERLLGEHIQLSSPVGIEIAPGEQEQILHRDDGKYPLPRPFDEVSAPLHHNHQLKFLWLAPTGRCAQVIVNTMWALDDFTEDNGSTVVYPGSHTGVTNSEHTKRRREQKVLGRRYVPNHCVARTPALVALRSCIPFVLCVSRFCCAPSLDATRNNRAVSEKGHAKGFAEKEKEEVAAGAAAGKGATGEGLGERALAVMPRGSCMFYRGSVLHGGGANRTDKPRLGVILEYAKGWLRPQENHCLAVPPRVVAGLPERLQELLGYNVHPPFIGYVDGRHPRRLLEDPHI
jgi:ectoine hydroxylase-related dioxygenase (phytanoyl-CoA dioxygenase family)